MTLLKTQARAKINLCLFLGPERGDGRHEIVTLMDTLDLCDEVRMQTDPPGVVEDEVVCRGVEGPNLAAAALRAFRDRTGWDGAPVRMEIDKRIPIAGGMGGGSADAAAALRLAAEASGLGDRRLLEEIAATLGADVPSQVRGGLVLATGTGSRVRPSAWRSPTASSSSRARSGCRPPTCTPRPTGSACRARRSTSPGR